MRRSAIAICLILSTFAACSRNPQRPTGRNSTFEPPRPSSTQIRSDCSNALPANAPRAGRAIAGCVVSVIDGDTLVLLDSTNEQYKIRLAGIDAPEHNQDFGQVSKQNLAQLVFQNNVWCLWHKKDRYGRYVGIVFLDGHDINIEQIRAGLAWHYKKYADEQSNEDREAYSKAENAARDKALQIWSMSDPIPPWDYRRKNGGSETNR